MRDSRQEILRFWFEETPPALWFQKNDEFDADIRDRFFMTYEMARDGLCQSWSVDADGCLALCLLLDQFPRNMFRGQAQAFATDAQALLVAKYGISKGLDQVLPPPRRRFLYLPFMHSEIWPDQNRSVSLFLAMREDDPVAYEYALRHRQVIEDFSRFPHRNSVLGRQSTPEELEYLSQPGSGF